jgi:uncharacterized protein YaaR (DUF327 family)
LKLFSLQCKWEKSEDEVESLLDKIHKETDLLLNDPKNNRVDLFEEFLKKYEKVKKQSFLRSNHRSRKKEILFG